MQKRGKCKPSLECMVFIFMLAVVFALCHCYAVCPQGLPGLPTLAALHSNQILTVKVCWLSPGRLYGLYTH